MIPVTVQAHLGDVHELCGLFVLGGGGGVSK